MRILLVGGGSGGHIYPCLELAKYFKENGDIVLLCGNTNSLEEKVYKENNFDFTGININKRRLKTQFRAIKEVKTIFDEFKPEATVLFGNYISLSFAYVSKTRHIPIYLHEQNVVMGRANKLISLFAKRIYLSLPIKHNLHKRKYLLVGNPKSDVIVSKTKLDHKFKHVLIVMGSLGSESINRILKEFIKLIDNHVIYHIVTGKKHYHDFINGLDRKLNVHIYPYLDNLNSYMKECDLFVSRSGATTISEILMLNTPSILVPSPYVTNNHQYKNARYLYSNGACELIKESDLDAKSLSESITMLLDDEKKIISIKENTKKLFISDSKRKIYEDIHYVK